MEDHGNSEACWRLFAATGDIYHYLDYKSQQVCGKLSESEKDGNSDNGPCAAPDQSGRGGPDINDPFA